MKGKVLIVSPRCPSCEVLKKKLEQKGILDRYEIIDVGTPEGMKFARNMDIRAVPECAIVEGEGKVKTVRICSEAEWKEMLAEI